MATGDYSQNEAMVKHFCPDVIENNIMRLFTNVDANGVMTNMGDGIKLGMWAGARVQQCHAPVIHHMGGGSNLAGVGVMGIAGFLNLNMNGKRFMNEDLPGQQIENQIEIQKDRPGRYLIQTGHLNLNICQPNMVEPVTLRILLRKKLQKIMPLTVTISNLISLKRL